MVLSINSAQNDVCYWDAATIPHAETWNLPAAAQGSRLDVVRKNFILRFDLGSGIPDRGSDSVCKKSKNCFCWSSSKVLEEYFGRVGGACSINRNYCTVYCASIPYSIVDFLRGNSKQQEGRNSFILVDARFRCLQRVDLTDMLCSTFSSLMESSGEKNNNSRSSVFWCRELSTERPRLVGVLFVRYIISHKGSPQFTKKIADYCAAERVLVLSSSELSKFSYLIMTVPNLISR